MFTILRHGKVAFAQGTLRYLCTKMHPRLSPPLSSKERQCGNPRRQRETQLPTRLWLRYTINRLPMNHFPSVLWFYYCSSMLSISCFFLILLSFTSDTLLDIVSRKYHWWDLSIDRWIVIVLKRHRTRHITDYLCSFKTKTWPETIPDDGLDQGNIENRIMLNLFKY